MSRLNLIQTGGGGVSGTLPISIAEVAHNWLDSYSSITGLFTQSRPAAADLSDTPAANLVLAGPTTGAAATATFRSLVAADIPNLDAGKITTGVLALARGGNTFALLGDLIYGGASAAPTVLSGNTTATKMYLSQTGAAGPVSAAPAWAQINYADITGTSPTPPSGSVLWSALGNAGAALTLANAGYATTFNQTSAVNWTWANTTAATIGTASALVTSAICRVNSGGGVSSSVNTTGSTLFVALVVGEGINAVSFSDNQGNTWNSTQIANASGGTPVSATPRIMYAYSKAGGSLATSASHTFTVVGSFSFAIVYAFSGTRTDAQVFESFVINNGPVGSPSFQIGSITPTQDDIVVTGIACNDATLSTATINQSFNTPILQTTGGIEKGATSYLLAATGAGLNPTWTTNGVNMAGLTACFRAAGTAVPQGSPILDVTGTVWNGSSSVADNWTIQDVITSTTNGASNLTFSHSGSSGLASVSVPNITVIGVINSITGLVNIGSTSVGLSYGKATGLLLLGNGSAGDSSGTLELQTLLLGTNTTLSANISSYNNSGTSIVLSAANGNQSVTIVDNGRLAIESGMAFGWVSSATNSTGATDTGISRLGAASLAIGNGTASDFSGSLKLTGLNVQGSQTGPYSVSLTAQAATIAATNLVATPVTTALYEITYYLNDTTAGTSGTVSLTITWNDGGSQTFTSSNVTFGTLGAYVSGTIVVKATSGAIQYATTVTSAVGSPAYSLDIRIKQLA